MITPALRVENLSKRYLIWHEHQSGPGLRHALNDAFTGFFKRRGRRRNVEEFWALRNVSFEVLPGEVIGVIGRNGAGKSTLLKILSRITEPTSGRVTIQGRVASLLEVGTGFHPELTGRENIFLNGAILGMSRLEIKAKFDEIVAFAEVERFLDTPVKRFSSGMYVRLAFAVAAHLEPDILIVDEVLAVGDTQFQKKCLGKMEEVSQNQGRTVLFVSHNMGVIQNLCPRAILLEHGEVICDAASTVVVARYLDPESKAGADGVVRRENRAENWLETAWLETAHGITVGAISCREPFRVCFSTAAPREVGPVEFSLRINTRAGQPVFTSLYSQSAGMPLDRLDHPSLFAVHIPGSFLMPGVYSADLALHEPVGAIYDRWHAALSFEIAEDNSAFARYGSYHEIGVVMPTLQWSTQKK